MPHRLLPLVTDQYYHIFNRSINKEPILTLPSACQRAMMTFNYYRIENPPMRLSYFFAKGPDQRQKIMESLKYNSKKIVEINSYCFMPNHYHILLKQKSENGISKFLALFQNSYTRYFNMKYHRAGHLFQGQFKAVRIEDEEQFIHVHRYIHLNPYTSYVVKTLAELERYPYSSLPEYLTNSTEGFCEKEIVLSHFAGTIIYKKFLFDQVDYQRKLDEIKHLIFE